MLNGWSLFARLCHLRARPGQRGWKGPGRTRLCSPASLTTAGSQSLASCCFGNRFNAEKNLCSSGSLLLLGFVEHSPPSEPSEEQACVLAGTDGPSTHQTVKENTQTFTRTLIHPDKMLYRQRGELPGPWHRRSAPGGSRGAGLA